MNCRRFQNELYEYLDGSLSPGAQAAAERHLAGVRGLPPAGAAGAGRRAVAGRGFQAGE